MDTSIFKDKLEEELRLVTKELKSLGVHNPEVEKDWITRTNDLDTVNADLNDVADRTEEYDTRRAELAVLEGRWNDVKKALKKIEEGTYGICEVSRHPIEEERLLANPAATTCKEHMEK